MLIKDLIKDLQKLLEEHEPHKDIIGEAEIMIDCYSYNGECSRYDYSGISPKIIIDRSDDGVYPIICWGSA